MVKCKVTEVIPLSKIHENPVLGMFYTDTEQSTLHRQHKTSQLPTFYMFQFAQSASTVHFQNGSLQPNHGLECLLARNDTNRLLAIAAQEDNVYTGTVGEGFAGDLMRNFIGIRNKVTNKVFERSSTIY